MTNASRISHSLNKEHATLTLINTATDEQGTTIKAIKGDVIIIKAKADDGYCIKEVSIDVPAEGNTGSAVLLPRLTAIMAQVTSIWISAKDVAVATCLPYLRPVRTRKNTSPT